MKNRDLTILEVIELNKEMKFLDVAKNHAPVGREKLREAMKLAGASFDQKTKRWYIQEGHSNEKKKVLDFVHSSRINNNKVEQVNGEELLKMNPVTGQSELNDEYFKIETKSTKIVRKKVSLDLDVSLHKDLKGIALENDMKLYELVESVLRNYVHKKNK